MSGTERAGIAPALENTCLADCNSQETIWAREFVTNLLQSDLPSFAGKFLIVIAINQQKEQHGHKLRIKQIRFFVVMLGFWSMCQGLLHP